MNYDIEVRPSQHKSSRKGVAVDGVIIHYTATEDAEHAIRWFEDPGAKVSAHFVIDVDGAITSCVPLSDKAWHAGASSMPGTQGHNGGAERSDVNRFTIGIELANAGKLVDRAGILYRKAGRDLVPYDGGDPVRATLAFHDGKKISGVWAPYPDEQIDALAWLLSEIAEDFGDDVARNVMGHDEVALPMGRKIDPGPAFPWYRINRNPAHRTSTLDHVDKVKAAATFRALIDLDLDPGGAAHKEATADAAKNIDGDEFDG